jgi:hypothetical protein
MSRWVPLVDDFLVAALAADLDDRRAANNNAEMRKVAFQSRGKLATRPESERVDTEAYELDFVFANQITEVTEQREIEVH